MARWSPNALIPFFCSQTCQAVSNHVFNGNRVLWSNVPSTGLCCRPHVEQCQRLRDVTHDFVPPHLGQVKPSGHLKPPMKAIQASLVENEASNSRRVRGYTSGINYKQKNIALESSAYPVSSMRLPSSKGCLSTLAPGWARNPWN